MKSDCEYCLYYEYDEECESYSCVMCLDEDEMERYVMSRYSHCPYFRQGDEYTIVRKQN